MKKLVSILLLLVLTFSLAACGAGSDTAPEPNEQSGETEPKEEERQLIIGFNTNNMTNETMSFMMDVFYDYGKQNNIKILTAEDGGDSAKTQTNLENFVAAGADGVIIRVNDPTGIEMMIEDLVEKGVKVVAYDEKSEAADYSFLCSNYDLGYAIGQMAAEWANEAIDDDNILMGLISVEVNESSVNRSDGIQNGFLENCPRGEVFRMPLSGDKVEVFYNMLSARPDIKICTSLADAVVVGIAEAWYADIVGAGGDVSEYGVFSTDATDIALNLIAKSKTDESIYRGTVDLGLKDTVPLGMIQCCHAAILGKDAPEGYEKINYFKTKFVTAKNIDEYEQFID